MSFSLKLPKHTFIVPSSPVNVVSYGDVIVWEEPLSPNGVINKYEIQFFVLGSELSLTRSRNRYGTFYIVKDEDQLGKSRNANTYFRVKKNTDTIKTVLILLY